MNIQLDIETIGTDGRGVAKPTNESIVFVEGALPGETVLATIHHQKKNFREATAEQIVTQSPQRVAAPCQHYGVCGGCNLQHASIAAQHEFKKKWLLETLRRLGQWPQTEWNAAEKNLEFFAHDTTSYRQRIRVHCDGKNVGFRTRKSHAIVNINDCIVAHSEIRKNWKQLREQILIEHKKSRAEEFEITVSTNDIVIVPVLGRNRTDRNSNNENSLASASIKIQHPFVNNFLIHRQSFVQPHKAAMDCYAKKIKTLIDNFIVQKIQTAQKANTHCEAIRAWDLYAGSGPFSMISSLAASEQNIPATTTAVEGLGPATLALQKNTVPWNVRCITSDVGTFCTQNATDQPNIVVLDPPRSGATPEVMEKIAFACAKTNALIIYVACDPASLARDSRTLFEHGFSLSSLSLYDMFPQTTHYETVAAFCRRSS